MRGLDVERCLRCYRNRLLAKACFLLSDTSSLLVDKCVNERNCAKDLIKFSCFAPVENNVNLRKIEIGMILMINGSYMMEALDMD